MTGVAGAGGSASCVGAASAGVSGTAGSGGAAGTAGGGGTTGAGGGGTVSCAGLDIDIPSALVTGRFKINGTTVNATTDAGDLSLRTAGGDVVPLGRTSAGSYSVRVVPGTYDLVYQASTPEGVAPRNTAAKLRTVTIGDAAGITTLDIDVPSVVVTGALKINGATHTLENDAGVLTLRNGTDVVTLGSTSAGSYSVRVVPGNYDVYYKSTEQGPVAPHNFAAKLQSVVIAAGCTTVLDIDVPAAYISGTPKIAGAAVATVADSGTLSLRTGAGDSVTLGSTTGPYLVKVVPGSYDVYYQSAAPGVTAPRNSLARLQSIVVAATGNTTVDVDIPSVVVSGTLKINGATVASTADGGNLSLRTSAGDMVALGNTATGSYSVRVVPGSYDAYYQSTAAGATAPRNTLSRLQSVAVAATGATTLDIDVPSAAISGTVKINGATVAIQNDAGILSLRTDAGDTVPLGMTSAGQYSVRAIPGTYDIYYQVFAAGANVPRNGRAKIRSGAVVSAAGTTTLNIDVPASNVTGLIMVNNMLVSSTGDYGTLSLRTAQDLITLGPSHTGSYNVRIIPGSYDVHYAVGAAGTLTLAPHNMLANLRCLTVP